MEQKKATEPDNTAVRTALWRALHTMIDAAPCVIEDKVGYELIQPEPGWQERPDMKYTRRLRASIVARARFVEDVARQQIEQGIKQYVLLGAGLDSFAQRNTALSANLDIYEIDQPGTLVWKEQRLRDNGYSIPRNLHFVPVDFEVSSWWSELLHKGFDIAQKTFVSCTGVTLYLTQEAITYTLKKMAALAPGSTIAIAFYLPLEQLDEEDRPMQEMAIKGAAAAGTPFVSFLPVEAVVQLAEKAGFKHIDTISTREMTARYFKDRTDELVPASGEFFLVAGT